MVDGIVAYVGMKEQREREGGGGLVRKGRGWEREEGEGLMMGERGGRDKGCGC